MLGSIRQRISWLAATLFFGFQIRFDFLGILDPTYKAQFQQDSDSLVVDLMLNPGSALFPQLGGVERNYASQFGLQGMVMNWLSPGDHFYEALRLTTSMLTGAVFAAAVIAVWRAWGGRAASVLFALLAISFWTNGFGASTYWQLWTLLLPTLVPLLVWPHLGSGRRKWLRGGAIIAGLVFLKCLCGYEFISTVLLGVAAAVGFHEFRGRIDRRLLSRLVLAMATGLVGFVLAVGVHVAQLMAKYGDASIIRTRMFERTVSPSDAAEMLVWARGVDDPLWGWLVQGDSMLGLWAFQLVHYLTNPAVAIPAPEGTGFGLAAYGIPIWAFVVVFALIAGQAVRGRQEDAAVQRRLALSAGIALAGGMSWLVLAYGHMIHHAHMDSIVFYLPFLPLVFAMIALRVQTISHRAWPTRSDAAVEEAAPRRTWPRHEAAAPVLPGPRADDRQPVAQGAG
ncbi:hypothetical protein QOZ88_09205 [Blastococcus sp. BMG 814]|uniref:Glycosyltransferase RgtA/B/C/D-like domain-containing protein n=1 Tax=Blastococcus carthaginiensis TaxID=3050034 RepID=A0ABT9IC80_9ACTN|nr:hypothetical protein [Blastococcus carthaginiensis]MDP5182817.1 hypothetical protein [Blastococcus carthaginiensis]